MGLYPEFIFTDKDFAQINAAQFTWKDIKVQLCKWYIKKAIITHLSNNKTSRSSFNLLSEFGTRFPFNNIE